jgi:hypothetical protein
MFFGDCNYLELMGVVSHDEGLRVGDWVSLGGFEFECWVGMDQLASRGQRWR